MITRRCIGTLVAFAATAMVGACTQVKLVERSGCLACHRPLQPDGTDHGIERAHPEVAGKPLSCISCHGGDPAGRSQSTAHVASNGAKFIRNLTAGELDLVDKSYLRFINPGDYRVVAETCGQSDCHESIAKRVITNQMATFSGELGVARLRAGVQTTRANRAVYSVSDPDFVEGQVGGTVGSLNKMEDVSIAPGETAIGPFQDLYLTKACMRCHTWSFGDNKFVGDYRSSGCTSCHMEYGDKGLSISDDPFIAKDTPPHPRKHVLTKAPSTNQCVHCHYRGARIGLSYQGYREGAGQGLETPHAAFLAQALHGHDASFYVTDEDQRNGHDETPPDVHFSAGMDCIDCHTEHDVHGDGRLYTTTTSAVEIRCEDCHGTIDAESTLKTRLGNALAQLSRDAGGRVWLTTKRTNKRLRVPQIKEALDKASPDSFLHRSMGRDASGFSHVDSLSCYSCHSGWMPNCYGCHVSIDMSKVQRSLVSGMNTPGQIAGRRKWVAVSDMILMIDNLGRIGPSMPTERMFVTVRNGAGETIVDNQPRAGQGGVEGMGQRVINPHTIRRWSPFMFCSRCHATDTAEEDQTLNVALGFGSDRYKETDGNGKVWKLDRVQSETFVPEVLVGNDKPVESKPLTPEIIGRMLSVVVPGISCFGEVDFPRVRDVIFHQSCATAGCHDAEGKAGSLDLSKDAAYASLVGKASTGDPSKTLVVPGDPESSYLMSKISRTKPIEGARMPSGREPLSSCKILMLQRWIAEGANP